MEDNNKLDNSDLPEMPSEEAESPMTPSTPPVTTTTPETKESQEPTRFQRFMRKVLTWLTVAIIVFGAGFATFYFTLYQDKVEKLDEVEQALTQAEQTASALTDQVADITAERDDLANEQEYRQLLSIMVDIYTARLALSDENTAAAKSALSDTKNTLDEIIRVIREFDANLAITLPQRLALIRSNIDGNLENAIADCDLMIKDLRDIEKALYQ